MSLYEDRVNSTFTGRRNDMAMGFLARHGLLPEAPPAPNPEQDIQESAQEIPTPPRPKVRGGRPRPQQQLETAAGMKPEKSLWEETKEAGTALFVRGPIMGAAGIAGTISDLSQWAAEKTGTGSADDVDPAGMLEEWLKSVAPAASGDTGDEMLSALGQFLVPFGAVSKVTKAGKALEAGKGFLRKATEAAGTGAITDFAVWDEADKNLSTVLNAIPELEPYVPDLMVHGDDYENPVLWRVQNVLEGAGLGVAAEGVARMLGQGIKAVGDARRAKEAGIGSEQLVTLQRLREVPEDAAVGNAATRKALDALRAEVEEALPTEGKAELDGLDGAPKADEGNLTPEEAEELQHLTMNDSLADWHIARRKELEAKRDAPAEEAPAEAPAPDIAPEQRQAEFDKQVADLQFDIDGARADGDLDAAEAFEDELAALKKAGPEAVQRVMPAVKQPIAARPAPEGPKTLSAFEKQMAANLEARIPTLEGEARAVAERQLEGLIGKGVPAKEAADTVEWMLEAATRLEPDKRHDLYAKLRKLDLKPPKPKATDEAVPAPATPTSPDLEYRPPEATQIPLEAVPPPKGPNLERIEAIASGLRERLDKAVAEGTGDEALAQATEAVEAKLGALKAGVPDQVPTISRIPKADTVEAADAQIAELEARMADGDPEAAAGLVEAIAQRDVLETQAPAPKPEAEAEAPKPEPEAQPLLTPEQVAQAQSLGGRMRERAALRKERPALAPDVEPDVAPVARGWSQWTHGTQPPARAGKSSWKDKPSYQWTPQDAKDAAAELSEETGATVETVAVTLSRTADRKVVETFARGVKTEDGTFIPAGKARDGQTTWVKVPEGAGPAARRALVEALDDPRRLAGMDLHVAAEPSQGLPKAMRPVEPTLPDRIPDMNPEAPALGIPAAMRGSAPGDYVLDKANLMDMATGSDVDIVRHTDDGQVETVYGKVSLDKLGEDAGQEMDFGRLESLQGWWDLTNAQRDTMQDVTPAQRNADLAALETILGPDIPLKTQVEGGKGWRSAPRAALKVLNQSASRVVKLAREANEVKVSASPGPEELDAQVIAQWKAMQALVQHKALMADLKGDKEVAFRLMDSVAMQADASQPQQVAAAARRIFSRDFSSKWGADDGYKRVVDQVTPIAKLKTVGDVHELPLPVGPEKKGTARKVGEVLQTAALAGLVSGPKTHAVNLLSAGTVNIAAVPEMYLAAAFRYAGGKMGGDAITFRDALMIANAEVVGRIAGARNALTLARGSAATFGWGNGRRAKESLEQQGLMDAFRALNLTSKFDAVPGENPTRNLFHERKPGAEGIMAVGKRWGERALQAPFAALQAEDMVMKSMGYFPALLREALVMAHKSGATGKAMRDEAHRLLNDPEAAVELRKAAVERAEDLTFTRPYAEGERFAGIVDIAGLTRALDRVPPFGRILGIPFLNTVSRISEYTAGRTPLALMRPNSRMRQDLRAGGMKRSEALARLTVGSSVMTMAGLGVYNGVITGPTDHAHPNSLRLSNGDYLDYGKLDPFAGWLKIGTGVAEMMQYAETPEHHDAISHLAGMAMEVMYDGLIDSSWMGGVVDIMGVIGDTRRGERLGPGLVRHLGGAAGAFIPYSGLTRQIRQGMDPVRREWRIGTDEEDAVTRALDREVDRIRNMLPGLGRDMPPMRTWNGKKFERHAPEWMGDGVKGWWFAMSPMPLYEGTDDPAEKLMHKVGFVPPRVPDQIDGQPLTPHQRDAYAVLTGEIFETALRRAMQSGRFLGLDTAGPAGFDQIRSGLKEIAGEARTQGTSEFLAQERLRSSAGVTVGRLFEQSRDNAGRIVREESPDLNRAILERKSEEWRERDRLEQVQRRMARQ